MEVHDSEEHGDCGEEVEEVRGVAAVEGMLESLNFAGASEEQMEESDDGAFELALPAYVDSDGAE